VDDGPVHSVLKDKEGLNKFEEFIVFNTIVPVKNERLLYEGFI